MCSWWPSAGATSRRQLALEQLLRLREDGKAPQVPRDRLYTLLYGEVMYRPPRWTVFEPFERLSPR